MWIKNIIFPPSLLSSWKWIYKWQLGNYIIWNLIYHCRSKYSNNSTFIFCSINLMNGVCIILKTYVTLIWTASLMSYSCQHNQGKWWHELRKGLNLPKTLRIGDHHFLHRSLEDRKFQVCYLFPWEVYVKPFRPKRHIASHFQVGLVSVPAISYTHQSYNWEKRHLIRKRHHNAKLQNKIEPTGMPFQIEVKNLNLYLLSKCLPHRLTVYH